MALRHVASAGDGRPYADQVQHVSADAPFTWLAAGWRDLCASPGASLAYGLIFVAAGLVLAVSLIAANMIYLFVPLAHRLHAGGTGGNPRLLCHQPRPRA